MAPQELSVGWQRVRATGKEGPSAAVRAGALGRPNPPASRVERLPWLEPRSPLPLAVLIAAAFGAWKS